MRGITRRAFGCPTFWRPVYSACRSLTVPSGPFGAVGGSWSPTATTPLLPVSGGYSPAGSMGGPAGDRVPVRGDGGLSAGPLGG